jgi:hypothetical protein
MADFDTTKIKQNAPGLTYATPKAMPAKFNSLGAAAETAETLIKGATALDKSMTLSQASDLASSLADDYELSSRTGQQNLLTDKRTLEADLAKDPGNEKITDELNVITTRLESAKEQGIISAYEFERRILKETQDLSSSNPAYVDEIAARVNKTLGLLTRDAALEKANQDAQSKELTIITKYLNEKKSISTLGLSIEDIVTTYQIEMNKDRKRNVINEILGDTKLSKTVKQAQVRQHIDSLGGVAIEGTNIIKAVSSDLNVIVDKVNAGLLKPEDARRQKNVVIEKYRAAVNNLATIMDDDESYKSVYTETMNRLKAIEEETEKSMSGANLKDFLNNQVSIISTKQELNHLQQGGMSKEMSQLKNEAIKSYLFNIKELGATFTQEMRKQMLDEIMIMSSAGTVLAPNSTAMLGFKQNPEVAFNQMNLMTPIFEKMIGLNNGTEIKTTDIEFSYFNNIFATSQSQTDSNTRFDVSKNLLNRLANMNDNDTKTNVVDFMLKPGRSSWETNLQTELQWFKSTSLKNAIDSGVKKDQIGIDDNGIFYANTYQGNVFAEELNTSFELQMKHPRSSGKVNKETAIEFYKQFEEAGL